MYVLKVFHWKTTPGKLRFHQLIPIYGAAPSSQGKGKQHASAADPHVHPADATPK
ncbi:Uncharacterised protein [Achromobacter sp. 2789STDY5608633]|jgi:hypothetical protein|nr:Uncharacterised protein [Achromobacter sp. 2789STDY5608633]CUJ80350.1 Uncharacterised protein [Achromobacter sp. 2789STDY5608628]